MQRYILTEYLTSIKVKTSLMVEWAQIKMIYEGKERSGLFISIPEVIKELADKYKCVWVWISEVWVCMSVCLDIRNSILWWIKWMSSFTKILYHCTTLIQFEDLFWLQKELIQLLNIFQCHSLRLFSFFLLSLCCWNIMRTRWILTI